MNLKDPLTRVLASRAGHIASVAAALLLAVRFWRDERPDMARLKSALHANAPYVALTLALCATRLVPPLRDFLQPLWALRPFDNQPTFAPLYAPGFWLVSIGLVVVWLARAPLSRVLAETGRAAWRSCAVTLAFVVMAEFYVGSGMATAIAEALRGAGYAGPVTLVGDEHEPPYERPALSKGVLLGDDAPESTFIHAREAWGAKGVDLVTGVRAEAIAPGT